MQPPKRREGRNGLTGATEGKAMHLPDRRAWFWVAPYYSPQLNASLFFGPYRSEEEAKKYGPDDEGVLAMIRIMDEPEE
jgi:hypothetical protein